MNKRMEVKVGQVLKFRDETWLVSKISETRWTEFAGCTAKEYQELYIDAATNHQILDRHFDEFDRTDIVAFERNEVVLEQTGKNIFFLVTKLHAHRVDPNGQKEESDGILRDSTNVSA